MSFSSENFILNLSKHLPKPRKSVLVLMSGGVDSTTTAYVLRKIGWDVRGLFIDSGFLREGEAEQVLATLQSLDLNCEVVNK